MLLTWIKKRTVTVKTPEFSVPTALILFFFFCFFLIISAADDPPYYVSVVRLGSVQQRHDCVLLVRNKIQGNLLKMLRFNLGNS